MYVRVEYPKIQCFDNNGNFAVGYEVHVFRAGTTTALTSYTDRTLTVPNSNPVILDARGEADIFIKQAAKLILTAPDAGTAIWTVDYYGEFQQNFVTGAATPVTANNNYVVATVPAVSALSSNFQLIMTPDLDNADTIVSNTFTGTGINDCTASGPYVGTPAGSIFTVVIDGATEAPPGAPTAAENVAAGLVTVGNHYVKISFVTAIGETVPGTASGVVAAAGAKKIDVTAIPVGSAQVTARNVYMTEAGGTDYYYVGQVAGNIVTTFTISIADATLGTGIYVLAPTTDTTNAGDTFKWKKDGGAYTTEVAITGVAQNLIEGVKLTFAVTAGHTLADTWAVLVRTPARVNLDTLGNLIVYKNKGASIVPLDGGDMKAGYPAQLILNAALNAWLLINPATPVFTTTTIQAVRYRKNLTGAYALLLSDQGYELSCDGTFTIDLLTPPEFSYRFVYINNIGTGDIAIDAGTYNIISKGVTSSIFYIPTGGVAQFVTNGVDWHVLTFVAPNYGYNFYSAGAVNWTCPRGVAYARVTGAGGGGGGGSSSVGGTYGGAGGGGGCVVSIVAPVPGTAYLVTIGAGGAGSAGGSGAAGGNTTLGAIFTAVGGVGGTGGGGPWPGGASGNQASYPGQDGGGATLTLGGTSPIAGLYGNYSRGGNGTEGSAASPAGQAGFMLIEWFR
jgi:hypothetical protein